VEEYKKNIGDIGEENRFSDPARCEGKLADQVRFRIFKLKQPLNNLLDNIVFF